MSAENDPRACSTTPGANPDWWHHDNPRLQHAARAICAGCPVRTPCLELALTEGEPQGIWGGLDPAERTQLARTLGLPTPKIRPPHGHRTRYVGTRNTPGCRCLHCTAAHARYEHLRRTGQLPEEDTARRRQRAATAGDLVNFDEAARFLAYDYCPRGSGNAEDHKRKMLTHATVLGRRVCIAIEALTRHRTR